MAAFRTVVQETRSYRHFVGLPPGTPLTVCLLHLPPATRDALAALERELVRLAGLDGLVLDAESAPAGAVRDMVAGIDLAIVLPAGVLGVAERERLAADLAAASGEAEKVRARLADATFVARAPEEIVAGARERLRELERKAVLLAETLGLAS
jgi:valyl-tRNA synthetase